MYLPSCPHGQILLLSTCWCCRHPYLSSIPKKPFYRVSVHDPRANALTLYHTVDLHDCGMSQQQRFDAEPSFICKKNVFGGMLLLYPLVMQFLPSRKPGKRLKKARLPLSCISRWAQKSATWLCIIHAFVVQAEGDPIVCYISMVGCYKSCILQASHSSENRHFYQSAEKWAWCSGVVQMPHHTSTKFLRPYPYWPAPCHTSNCTLNSLKMTAREMWQYS